MSCSCYALKNYERLFSSPLTHNKTRSGGHWFRIRSSDLNNETGSRWPATYCTCPQSLTPPPYYWSNQAPHRTNYGHRLLPLENFHTCVSLVHTSLDWSDLRKLIASWWFACADRYSISLFSLAGIHWYNKWAVQRLYELFIVQKFEIILKV